MLVLLMRGTCRPMMSLLLKGRLPICRFAHLQGITTPRSAPVFPAAKPRIITFGMAIHSSTSSMDEQIERKAIRVRELEKEADDMHKLAQLMNKQGRYEEAANAYSAMHALEDEATALAREVGCVACVLGDPTCGAATVVGAAEAAAYLTLLPAAPWPSSSTSSSSSDGVTPAQAAVLRARTMGAVMGSLVADAAAAGCHWIYDLDLMTTLAQEATNRHLTHSQVTRPTGTSNSTDHHTNSSTSGSCRIADAAAAVSRALYAPPLEFQDPPRSPYYTYAVGRNSPYGEQALVLLRSVAGAGGLDCIDYAHKFGAYFGAGFDGYRDVSTKGFLRNYERGAAPPLTGAADAQANAIARVAVLVSGWAGSGGGAGADVCEDLDHGLPAAVRRATRVTQNSEAAVAWALAGAGIMERLVTGRQLPSEAVVSVAQEVEATGSRLHGGDHALGTTVASHLRAVTALAHLSPCAAFAQLGRNCHMPNALTSPLHIVLHLEHLARATLGEMGNKDRNGTAAQPAGADGSGADGQVAGGWDGEVAAVMGACYAQGVRAAIVEGGCCASRAAYVGGCLGALAGWVEREAGGGRDEDGFSFAAGGGCEGGGEHSEGEGGSGQVLVGLPCEWVGRYGEAKVVLNAVQSLCEARARVGVKHAQVGHAQALKAQLQAGAAEERAN